MKGERLTEHWNEVAAAMGRRNAASSDRWLAGDVSPLDRYRSRRVRAVLDALSVTGSDVLEIGPGRGVHLKELHRKGARVRGVDVSATMCSLAREENADWAPEDTFVTADGVRLPFADHSFDLVLTVTVLQHNEDDTVRRLAGEIRRVLRPDGQSLHLEDTTDRRRDLVSWVGRTPTEYERLFASAGMELVGYRCLGMAYWYAAHRVERLVSSPRAAVERSGMASTVGPTRQAWQEGETWRGVWLAASWTAAQLTRVVDRVITAPEGIGVYELRAAAK